MVLGICSAYRQRFLASRPVIRFRRPLVKVSDSHGGPWTTTRWGVHTSGLDSARDSFHVHLGNVHL